MKSTGIVRKVDELGRIVLPKKMLKNLDIQSGDEVEIFSEGERIVISKYTPACIFCDSSEQVFIYNGKRVCAKCLENLKAIN